MPTAITVAPPDADEEEEEEELCETCRDPIEDCECSRCESCETQYTERVWDPCDNCNYCRSCCECYWCESCEAHYYGDYYCGDCDRCTDCCSCSDSESDSEYIHDYGYTPHELTFHSVEEGRLSVQHATRGAPDGATYLGLEIECEAVHGSPDDIAREWAESPFGYSKHDGSLSDGVECVTHPYTYGALVHNDLPTVLKRLSSAGGRAWRTGTCGLHIHVSRGAFAHRSHLWRFVRALDNLQTELIQLAGRDCDQWASWQTDDPTPAEPCSHPDCVESRANYPTHRRYGRPDYCYFRNVPQRPRATKIVAGKATSGTRYRAINLENAHTVELRFWRGSLAPETVLGAAALTDALVEWTRTLPFRHVAQGLTFTQFMAWAGASLPSQQYADITTLCDKRSVTYGELAACAS